MDVIKKISILVFVVVSLTGCDKFVALFHRDSEPETHGYYLALIFENSSGENLAESIELSNCDYDLFNGEGLILICTLWKFTRKITLTVKSLKGQTYILLSILEKWK